MRAFGSLQNPAFVFLLLSLFALPIIVLHPPLRGPDEDKHFVRAYGISQGEFVPGTVDARGRRGIFVPAPLADDFTFYNEARQKIGREGFNYRETLAEHMRRASPSAGLDTRPPVFLHYEGAEAYSPVGYVPYALGALLARWSGLNFTDTILTMRIAGFVATTALAAYAIATVPYLGWAFMLIAMLPAALYARALVSVDGGTLGLAMLVAALSLRAVQRADTGKPWERALWMTLCILAKPPQIAFALLEGLVHRRGDGMSRWRTIMIVTVPGVVLTILWIFAISGDIAIWRMTDATGIPLDQFDPLRKLWLMLSHPLHFPTAMLEALRDTHGLWRQLIGVLGWLNIPLSPFVYAALSAAMLITWLAPLPLDRNSRMRIAVVSGLTAVAYGLAVFLTFYLSYTPISDPGIWGVQGRYFIVILPLIAAIVGSVVRWNVPRALVVVASVASATLSGAACIEAVLRAG